MIYLISDSLSLPRLAERSQGGVNFEETYPVQLEKVILAERGEKCRVLSDGHRGRSVRELPQLIRDEARHFQPKYLVLQVGIVDCAPRVIRRWQSSIVNLFLYGRFRSRFYRFLGRYRRQLINWSLPKVLTSPRLFKRLVRKSVYWASRCPSQVVWVGIAPPTASYCDRSPGVRSNIEKYNALIRVEAEKCGQTFLDFGEFLQPPEAYLLEDGHHLNSAGNEILARLLANELINFEN